MGFPVTLADGTVVEIIEKSLNVNGVEVLRSLNSGVYRVDPNGPQGQVVPCKVNCEPNDYSAPETEELGAAAEPTAPDLSDPDLEVNGGAKEVSGTAEDLAEAGEGDAEVEAAPSEADAATDADLEGASDGAVEASAEVSEPEVAQTEAEATEPHDFNHDGHVGPLEAVEGFVEDQAAALTGAGDDEQAA